MTTEDDEENWEVVKKKKTKKSNENKDNKENKVYKFVTQGEYKCDQCNKSFVKMQQLRKHNVNWHEELNCYICQKLLPSKKEIMTHKERAHKMLIRECKYFSEGTCQDGAEECIYSHGNNKRDQNGQEKHQNKPGKENREHCKTINCRDQRCQLSHLRKSRSEIICRYGNKCNREDCDFKHENRINIKTNKQDFHTKQRKSQRN